MLCAFELGLQQIANNKRQAKKRFSGAIVREPLCQPFGWLATLARIHATFNLTIHWKERERKKRLIQSEPNKQKLPTVTESSNTLRITTMRHRLFAGCTQQQPNE